MVAPDKGRTPISDSGATTLSYVGCDKQQKESSSRLYDDLEEQPSDKSTSSSIIHRLGITTVTTLGITTFVILAVIAFLAFLWHSDAENSLWHTIIAHQWLARAITISSFALRSSVDLQIGIASAAVAAIILEAGVPLLRYAPYLSTARASKPKPRTLLFPAWRSTRSNMSPKQLAIAIVLSILCCTALLLQFSSTFLLSDLRLGAIPGLIYTSVIPFDFVFPKDNMLYQDPSGWTTWSTQGKVYRVQRRGTTWLRNPPAYRTFAEYSEPAPSMNGVDDTGVLLRAFLPFADAESRQSLKEYSGKAFVLDSRVSCQPPKFEHLYSKGVKPNDHGYRKRDFNWKEDTYFTVASVEGTYGPSREAERLWTPDANPGFHCYVALWKNVTSICQVQGRTAKNIPGGMRFVLGNRGGGLISEFSNITLKHIQNLQDMEHGDPYHAAYYTWGTAMLVFRALEWDSIHSPGIGLNYTSSSDGSLRYQERGPWLDIMQSGHGAGISANISASLCYAAWDTSKLSVDMFSETNRTEPVAYWDPERRLYTIPSIISQLGANLTGSHTIESRGLLSLKKKESWVRTPEDADPINFQPYVQQFGDMSLTLGPSAGPTYMTGNWTAFLSASPAPKSYIEHYRDNAAVIWVDPDLMLLFDSFMEHSGSLARSISSMITVLSSMAYFDQFPRFLAKTNATQLFFSTVLLPQSAQGFWTVIALIIIHLGLVCISIVLFHSMTRFTLIGNHWSSVSQMWMPQTSELLLSSSRKRDKDVREELAASGRAQASGRVEEFGAAARVGLVENSEPKVD